jgi:zinc transporter 2
VDQEDDRASRQVVLKKLHIAVVLCSIFLLVEVVGGWWAGSLAILSDASHLFADLASFCVAIVASHLASLPCTTTHTFGLQRAESLAALISMLSLAVVSIGLAVEALRRLFVALTTTSTNNNDQVNGLVMSGIAAIGVLVNIVLALVLSEDHIHMPGASDEHHGHTHEHHEHGASGHSEDNNMDAQKVQSHVQENQTFIHNNHAHNHAHDHPNNEDHRHHHHDTDDSNGHDEEHQGLLSSAAQHEPHVNYNTVLHLDEARPVHARKVENINFKAAYLHVLGDLAQSIAVLVAGIVLWIFPKAQIVDPLCTLLFCCLVFFSTLSVLRSSVAVLLEEIPPQIDWMKVYEAISAVPDVSNVHDLHIWCISHGEPSLSVHCVTKRPNPDDALKDIYDVCQ